MRAVERLERIAIPCLAAVQVRLLACGFGHQQQVTACPRDLLGARELGVRFLQRSRLAGDDSGELMYLANSVRMGARARRRHSVGTRRTGARQIAAPDPRLGEIAVQPSLALGIAGPSRDVERLTVRALRAFPLAQISLRHPEIVERRGEVAFPADDAEIGDRSTVGRNRPPDIPADIRDRAKVQRRRRDKRAVADFARAHPGRFIVCLRLVEFSACEVHDRGVIERVRCPAPIVRRLRDGERRWRARRGRPPNHLPRARRAPRFWRVRPATCEGALAAASWPRTHAQSSRASVTSPRTSAAPASARSASTRPGAVSEAACNTQGEGGARRSEQQQRSRKYETRRPDTASRR